MKVSTLITGACIAAAALTVPTVSQAQDPGPGWYRWHSHRYDRDWDGPRWYNRHGPHYGWYQWHRGWYRNCSWRWIGFHRRVWRCW